MCYVHVLSYDPGFEFGVHLTLKIVRLNLSQKWNDSLVLFCCDFCFLSSSGGKKISLT